MRQCSATNQLHNRNLFTNTLPNGLMRWCSDDSHGLREIVRQRRLRAGSFEAIYRKGFDLLAATAIHNQLRHNLPANWPQLEAMSRETKNVHQLWRMTAHADDRNLVGHEGFNTGPRAHHVDAGQMWKEINDGSCTRRQFQEIDLAMTALHVEPTAQTTPNKYCTVGKLFERQWAN
jgi:hypothetical protein